MANDFFDDIDINYYYSCINLEPRYYIKTEGKCRSVSKYDCRWISDKMGLNYTTSAVFNTPGCTLSYWNSPSLVMDFNVLYSPWYGCSNYSRCICSGKYTEFFS